MATTSSWTGAWPAISSADCPGYPGSRAAESSPLPLGLDLSKDLGGREQALADDRHAHIAGHVQERLRQLLFRPSLPEGHAQVDGELGLPPGGGVRDDADQRARLEIEARARPEGTEHRLGGHIDELPHDRVLVRRAVGPLDERVTQQFPTHLAALPLAFRLRLLVFLAPVENPAPPGF